MADPQVLDRAFHFIMGRMVETGHAPHYTDVARVLGVSVEEGRQVVRDLMNTGYPGWLHPETDYIASFPPLHALPTQYRITVDGEQRWFAQCGFEAMAANWVFPGKTVRIDAPCLDCNEPIVVEMRNGQLLRADPPDVIGHMNYPQKRTAEGRPRR